LLQERFGPSLIQFCDNTVVGQALNNSKPECRASYSATGKSQRPPIVVVQLPVGAGKIRRIEFREVFVDGRYSACRRIRRRGGRQRFASKGGSLVPKNLR
jgi:hypothetical protein